MPGSEYVEIDAAGRSVAAAVLTFIREKNVDFLCMGVRSMKDKNDVAGKNTLKLVQEASTNFLIAKSAFE